MKYWKKQLEIFFFKKRPFVNPKCLWSQENGALTWFIMYSLKPLLLFNHPWIICSVNFFCQLLHMIYWLFSNSFKCLILTCSTRLLMSTGHLACIELQNLFYLNNILKIVIKVIPSAHCSSKLAKFDCLWTVCLPLQAC